jgi:hypothetical protein
MTRMSTEVAMVLRGGSRTHRFLRGRLTFLAGATLAASLAAFFRARHTELAPERPRRVRALAPARAAGTGPGRSPGGA